MRVLTFRGAVLAVFVGTLVLFAACSDDQTTITPTDPAVSTSGINGIQQPAPDRTPFQRSIMARIEEREAQGLPVPADVSYEFSSTVPGALQGGRGPTVIPGEEIVITATTVLHFEHPNQAGSDRWPAFVIDGEVPPGATGHIAPGDYSEEIRNKVEEKVPDAWSRYEFGYEPRTYTFTETYTITCPELNPDDPGTAGGARSTKTGEVLMGFSVPGPGMDYSLGFDIEILEVDVLSFWAGFELDWDFGVRMPMEESCTAPEPMDEGSTYWPTNTAQGIDWSAADYSAAGVPPMNGNEFAMMFVLKCGLHIEVFGATVVNWGPFIDIDHSRSFATPFGPGATFPLPSLDLPLAEFPLELVYVACGFRFTPHLGSDKFTADWTVTGNASGGGSMVFTDPTVPVTIGPVMAIDGPGVASIDMDDFRYYFTQFLLTLDLYFEIDVFGWWDDSWTANLGEVDLSSFLGHLWIGTHAGTPDQLTAAFTIQNVAPTAVIDRTGTFMINGIPTFIASEGDVLTLTGEAEDPGYDDLTLTWDYDDGPPSPDVSTHYTVPYHVTESQTYTVAGACVHMVSFMAVDDDGAVGLDQVPVVVTGTADKVRSEGYWQHQLSRVGHTDFTLSEILCLLNIVSHMSTVFNEERDASTTQAAYDVMHLKQNYGSMAEQLDRELLAAWLNFANGARPYLGLIDTDGDDVGDATFADLITTAEAVRLNPGSTDEELEIQVEIVHKINIGGKSRVSG